MSHNRMKYYVSHETIEKLKTYIGLLLKWNKSVNLISESSEEVIWERHIEDSLQLDSILKDEKRVFDFGSGAGLPGIPLAISGVKNINLVEIDTRKCSFLRKVQAELELDIVIHNKFIKDIEFAHGDCVISRALWSISGFCEHLSEINFRGNCFLLKGERYQKELDEAVKTWKFDYELYPSITKSHSVILKLSNMQRI
jgi:16S rRNA (guanine527-N7)-methyltransferase